MSEIPYQAANEPDEERLFDGEPPDEDEDEREGRSRIPCSYPGCKRLTTFDPVYGDLCYEHIRAKNE